MSKPSERTAEQESGEQPLLRLVPEHELDRLRAEYGDRVPYVFVDGWPAFKYEVDAAELRRQLRDAA